MAIMGAEEPLERERRPPLLPAGQLGLRNGVAQARVPGGIPGQDDEVGPFGIRDAVLPTGEAESELGTEHRR